MKLIKPHVIYEENVIYVDIPENDHPPWFPMSPYNRGDYVISFVTHTKYRSLTNGNVGNDPDQEQAALADPLIDDPSPINWQAISATNRWKLFDKKPSVQAVSSNSFINVDLQFTEYTDGVAGFNIDATSINIEVYRLGGQTPLYIKNIQMQDDTVVYDWYSYYFSPIIRLTDFAVADIPPYRDVVIKVTIQNDGGIAACGQLIFGGVTVLGSTEVGNTGFSGVDFSYVDQDDFGDLTTVRREATRLSQFDVFAPNSTLLNFDRIMRSLRGGVAAVWMGDDDIRKAATNYGFSRNYRPIYKTSEYAIISLEIQGIV
jgi:hypothetical protein